MNTKEMIEYVKKQNQEHLEYQKVFNKFRKRERRRHKINKVVDIMLEVGGKTLPALSCILVLFGCVVFIMFICKAEISYNLLKWLIIPLVIDMVLVFLMMVLNNSRSRY